MKTGGTAHESITIFVKAAEWLMFCCGFYLEQGGARARVCVDISSLFFPPFEHKTKAGYVSQAADTKAPPDFALSSALFANLRRKSQTRTPVFNGIETAGSVTTR